MSTITSNHILLLGMICLFNIGCQKPASEIQTVNIAAAADTVFLFQRLKTDFESKHPNIKLQITHSASGTLVTQIEQGAPFDLFFSADDQYPLHLISTGHALQESLFNYGTGQLIIWIAPHVAVTQDSFQLKDLLNPQFQKISIANPAHAPYGKLAQQILEKAGLYERLKPKLVYGENISQAMQYVHTGAVDVGLISLSLTKNPALKQGTIISIPEEYAASLSQSAIQMKNSPHPQESRIFVEYLNSNEAQAIFTQQGFKN